METIRKYRAVLEVVNLRLRLLIVKLITWNFLRGFLEQRIKPGRKKIEWTLLLVSNEQYLPKMTFAISKSCQRQLFRDCSFVKSPSSPFLPAFSSPNSRRPFSASRQCQSRIGSAALSIPPEVSLQFIDLPAAQSRTKASTAPVTAVDITGPRGMSLHFNHYVYQKSNPFKAP